MLPTYQRVHISTISSFLVAAASNFADKISSARIPTFGINIGTGGDELFFFGDDDEDDNDNDDTKVVDPETVGLIMRVFFFFLK